MRTPVLLLVLIASLVTATPGSQGVLNEHLLILSTTEEGTAAIVAVWSPDRGLGTDSRTSVFPFADGARVSGACTSTERSSKCRDLVVIKSGTHGYIIQALLHNGVGLMELQYDGRELLHVQNRTLILQLPYETSAYIPVDISLNDDGTTVVFYLNSDTFCFGYIDVPDLATATHTRGDSTSVSFDYQYISNFVFFPDGTGIQYYFIHSGVLYCVRLDRSLSFSCNIPIDGSCNRLAYSGDYAFYAYCNSEQTSLTYDTDQPMISPTIGIPYVCSSETSYSTFQVYLNSTDQSTVVQHDQRNFTISGENFTFGVCYDDDTFFLVNDQGVMVLRPSSSSFSTISSNSGSLNVAVFDGPYLVAQDDDPPHVTLYDTSLQSIVEWTGSAMAVGVITDLRVVPSSTSSTAPSSTPTTPIPIITSSSESPAPMLGKGGLIGIIVATVVLLAALVSALIITCVLIKRRKRSQARTSYELKHLQGSSTPDSSSASDRSSNQDLLATDPPEVDLAPPPETHPAPPPEAGPASPPEAHPAPTPEAGPASPPEAHPAPTPESGPASPPEAHPAPPPEAGPPNQPSLLSHDPLHTITPTTADRVGNDHMVFSNVSMAPGSTFTPEQVAENDAKKLDTDDKINDREVKIRRVM